MARTPDAQIHRGMRNERTLRGLSTDSEDHKAWLTELSTQLLLIERTAAKVPSLAAEVKSLRADLTELISTNATSTVKPEDITALEDRIKKLAGDLAVLTDRVNGHDTRFDLVEDRVGVLERDPVFTIDFPRSTYVPVRGTVESDDSWWFWVLNLALGAVTGVLAGLVASDIMYDYPEWDWSFNKSVFLGVILGLVVFFFAASFERFRFWGSGRIYWQRRQTMQEQADEMARETAGQIPPPPPVQERTSVHSTVGTRSSET